MTITPETFLPESTKALAVPELYTLEKEDIQTAIEWWDNQARELKAMSKYMRAESARAEVKRLQAELERRDRWQARQEKFNELQKEFESKRPPQEQGQEPVYREEPVASTKNRRFIVIRDVVSGNITSYVIATTTEQGQVRQAFPTDGKEQAHVFADSCRTWLAGRG